METLVADLCSRNIVAAAPDTLVRQALELMTRSGKSSLLVLLQGEAIGILTERDCVRNAPKILAFPNLCVSDIMSSPLLTILENDSAFAAFHSMQQQQIRHLAVLDRNYDICGLLSITDLLFKYVPDFISPATTVGELMVSPVFTIAPTATVQQALAEMARRPISCLVVADGERPLGMLSERDIPRLLAAPSQTLQQPVASVMTSPHPTIPPQTTVLEAIALMLQRGIRRLVVAAADDQITGLVTQSRLGRAITP